MRVSNHKKKSNLNANVHATCMQMHDNIHQHICYLPATGLADVPLLVLAVQVELACRQDHFQIGCPRHHDLSEDDVVALASQQATAGPAESQSEASA